MKLVALLWLQLCFVSSVLSAAGDLGDACLSTDPKCTPRGSYCVSATSKCACGSNFVQSGTKCVPIYAQPCGAGMCPLNNICGTDGNCQACPTGSANFNGKCLKVIGQTCTATTDCISSSGVICDTRDGVAKKCTCDTNNKFGKGTDGDSRCSCDTGYTLRGDGTCGKTILTCTVDTNCQAGVKCDTTTHLCVCDDTKGLIASGGSCVCGANKALKADGTCGLVIGQACATAAECIDGVVCTGTPKQCACDSTQHLVASGTTGCACAQNYAKKADGSCGLVIGQACATAAECIDGVVCTGTPKQCACDSTQHLVASGTTGCVCDSNYAKKADGSCGLVIGQTCGAVAECIDGVVCTGTPNKCACDSNKHLVASGTTACVCDTNYAKKADGSCGLVVGQTTCTADTDCVDNALCTGTSPNKQCTCNTAKHFTTSGTGCACQTDYAVRDTSIGCGIKVAGTSCSTASDCADNMLCTGGFCTCDAAKNFTMTAAGVCGCKTTFLKKDDKTCGKVLDQPCTSDAECMNKAICKDVSGTKLCKCDDTMNYTASGTSACVCATNYDFRLDETCGKKVGQDCTQASDCMRGAACDLETKICVCDAANGYQLAAGSTTSCECMSGYTTNGIGCAKTTAATCSSTCSSYASCNATYGFCQCDAGATLNSDTYTCSTGSKAVMASVVLLLMVLVTSRLT